MTLTDHTADLPMRLVELIGVEATLALVSQFGGTEVSFGAPELARVIGADAVEQLGAALGPYRLSVPRAARWRIATRNAELCARWDAGETQAELALAFKLTQRQVGRICSDYSRRTARGSA